MDNISLSIPSKLLRIPDRLRNPNFFAHRKRIAVNPTKSFEMSSKCSQTKFSARPLYCLEISHASYKAFQLRAKDNQAGDTDDFASEREMNYNDDLIGSSNGKGVDKLDSPLIKISKFVDVLMRFTRPHIMLGTTSGFIWVMARTWMENAHLVIIPKWILLLRAMVILVALLSADGFINAINQIYDIEIDKINKPHYPLASGELSLQSAWILVMCFSIIGVGVPLLLKSGILLAWIMWMFIQGILYSVPPFSTKRSTLGAVFTCGSLRGYTLTICLSVATRTVLGLPFQLSKPEIFMAAFTTFFALVCGALKDIEDIEGDKKGNVPTLVSIYGPKKVAFFGFGTIILSYLGAIATAILMPQVFRRNVMIPAHIILASYFIIQARKWDKENYSKEASQSVYKSMWMLFDIEYFIFPFI
nr:prenytransferase [Hypericum perforatum]